MIICLVILHIIAKVNTGSVTAPNIIIFLADDLGYGDLQSYGHPMQEPTAVDWMIENGIQFTNWYSAGTLCTPSRSALLTGRQPVRSGVAGDACVFLPCLSTGLPRSEVTIAEMLKAAGYSTGMVGKWHLGINKDNNSDGYHLPKHHGFDFVGTNLPFTLQDYCDTQKLHRQKPLLDKCFLYYGDTLIEQPIQLEMLTGRITHDAVAFLHNQTRETPFFLFVSFPQTHTPMFNMPRFRNLSKRGAYGDQLLEMSWAMEEIFSALKILQLHENTASIFLSDHGPHVEICDLGGSPGPFRGGKGSYREGGLRVPAVIHWPSTICKPRVSDVVVNTMDLFPTLTELAGGNIPPDVILDGLSFTDVLFETEISTFSQRKLVYFMCQNYLIAVRYKDYKIYYRMLPELNDEQLSDICKDGIGVNYFSSGEDCRHAIKLNKEIVYDIKKDPKELTPLPVEAAEVLVQEISYDVSHYLSSFPEAQELLSRKFCDSSLVPCCNPPYCICKDIKMPKCPK